MEEEVEIFESGLRRENEGVEFKFMNLSDRGW